MVSVAVNEQVAAGIRSSALFLPGFSQGGADVCMQAMQSGLALGGVMALSDLCPTLDHLGFR